MIKGIGVDILKISRVFEMSKKMNWALAHQVLGPRELEVYAELSDDRYAAVQYLARRFAAKEAFIKASGGRASLFDMREVEVLNREDGSPAVALSGSLRADNRRTYHVSISDDDDHVIATVICEESK